MAQSVNLNPALDEEEGEIDSFKSTNKSGDAVKILTIGVGQGGSKLAYQIGIECDCSQKCVFINTSKRDIEGLDLNATELSRFISVGNGKLDGSGKNRHVSFDAFKGNLNLYIDEVKKYMKEDSYDLVLVCFSTAGGTGSGIGPKLTGALTSTGILNEVSSVTGKEPIVFGLAELPELSNSEGNLSYENTLEALQDIDKLVNPKDKNGLPIATPGLARFFLINNGYGKGRYSQRSDQLIELNKLVAHSFNRILFEYGYSRIATLDRADRIGALTTMGLHSFEYLDSGNDGNIVGVTPFFMPDGERVKRCIYEVPENWEKQTKDIIDRTGAIIDDTIHGYYVSTDTRNGAKVPIVGFHGFRNVSKIAEQYDRRLKLNRENQTRIESDNIFASTGLNDVEAEKKRRSVEYGSAGATDASSVFDL